MEDGRVYVNGVQLPELIRFPLKVSTVQGLADREILERKRPGHSGAGGTEWRRLRPACGERSASTAPLQPDVPGRGSRGVRIYESECHQIPPASDSRGEICPKSVEMRLIDDIYR